MVDASAVLVADRDPRFRAFISNVFQSAGSSTIEIERGEQVLAASRERRPDLIILDVGLSDVSGFEVCQQLRDEFGDQTPIIFVCGGRPSPVDRAAGFLVGGDDYLVKPINRDELLARARRLITRFRAARSRQTLVSRDFTKRESEVLALLADGLNSSDIARELHISPKTVASHVQRIIGKLGAHTRAEAIALAYKQGVIKSLASPSDTDFSAHVNEIPTLTGS